MTEEKEEDEDDLRARGAAVECLIMEEHVEH